jgi:hypothetical protein
MKIIPLGEAKARLGHYGRLCHKEPIIVTVNGVPEFQLVPLDEDDDLINQLLEQNPSFRELLQDRLREKNVSAKETARHL